MGHLLAISRVFLTQAALAMAALALVVVAGLSVLDHAPFKHVHAQSSVHHDHDAFAMERDLAHDDVAHHAATHPDVAQCCHDEDAQPDCASICAAMAGCPMQIMPGEGMIDIVTSDTGPISGKAAFHATISVIPSTPPPKARI